MSDNEIQTKTLT